MPLFYALTLFVSAFLLFIVQLLVSKMLNPLIGGTPVVWNTCSVFFQFMLLAGYLYAHASTKYLSVGRQVLVHLILLLVTCVALVLAAVFAGKPVAVSASLSPQGDRIPVFGILLVLLVAVGLPFFTVATSAPLLQRWFSRTGHPAAKDPYFLYGASNLGSVLALVGYQFMPSLNLGDARQSWLWGGGFLALALMVAACAGLLMTSPGVYRFGETVYEAKAARPVAEPLSWRRRLRWLVLAFAPASLMLGVTTYLATDIASVPMLWVIPLGLYLLTFIIAFSRLPGWFHTVMALAAPVALLLLIFFLLSGIRLPNQKWSFSLHLGVFFVVALACHCDLARSRPSVARLTEFYLIMSIGGVLGGLFNALVAPLIFNDVYEYRVGLAAAALCMPALTVRRHTGRAFVYDAAAALGMFAFALLLAVQVYRPAGGEWDGIAGYRRVCSWVANHIALLLANGPAIWISGDHLFQALAFGLPALACYFFVERPLRFGLCVSALLLAGHVGKQVDGNSSYFKTVLKQRSFFGVLEIDQYDVESEDGTDTYRRLIHGTTVHGYEKVACPPDIDESQCGVGEPISYYHPAGPIGDVWRYIGWPRGKANYAVIGLGTGTLAAYAQPGQKVTYYEIDPLVKRIAEDPKYFTFLHDCKKRGANYEIIMGDARVQLDRNKTERYGMIFVDAFSSDSIPVHLLTKEAMQLYFDRLEPGGVLILHISNRYLDLGPVVAKLAEDAQMTAWLGADDENDEMFKAASNWVVVAKRKVDLGRLPLAMALSDPWRKDFILQPSYRHGVGLVGGGMLPLRIRGRWQEMRATDDAPLWTDDFSNLLKIMRWE
ncbi:MAG: spermidine synthase [Gemmataceae bacterium]